MRVNNSLKNISISIFSQVIVILLGFITRKIFIESLGIEYLGLSGLLTNILSLLALAEGGIGGSIAYSLYEPIAKKDGKKIKCLIDFYKRIYKIIVIVILTISLIIYPLIINNKELNDLEHVGIIYIIFILKNIFPYFYSYKFTLIIADQKGWMIAKSSLFFKIITVILKIFILLKLKSYVYFLFIEFICLFFENIYNGRLIDKEYPYLKKKSKYNLDISEKENIIKNTKALFLHNIRRFIIFGTDNILIANFINLSTIGIYSNYTLVLNQLDGLLSYIFSGISASVGNLIAIENKEKVYEIFKVVYFINFLLYSLIIIILFNTLNEFIYIWLDKKMFLDKLTFIVMLINFYLLGLRSSIYLFKSKAGIFNQDKYASLVEGIINLLVSLYLVKQIGLPGIFIGTTVGILTTSFWITPLYVYKDLFNKNLKEYFINYLIYILITLLNIVITSNICKNIHIDSIKDLILRGLISVIVFIVVIILIFRKKYEYKYILNLIIKRINLRNKNKIIGEL